MQFPWSCFETRHRLSYLMHMLTWEKGSDAGSIFKIGLRKWYIIYTSVRRQEAIARR